MRDLDPIRAYGNKFQQFTMLQPNMLKMSRNAAILFSLNLAIAVVSVPLVAYLAHHLGAEGFGQYAVTMAYASVFMMVVDAGTGKMLTREVVRQAERASAVVGAFVIPKPILLLLLFIGVWIVSKVLHLRGSEAFMLFLSVAIAGVMAVAVANRAVFHAFQRMEFNAAGQLSERAATIAGSVIALSLGYGVKGVLVAVLLGNLLDASLGWFLAQKHFVQGVTLPSFAGIIHYYRLGLPIAIAAVSSTVSIRAGTILLDRFLDSSAAGWFNAAHQITVLLAYLPQAIGFAVFPLFSDLAVKGPNDLGQVFWKILLFMLLAGTVAAIATFVLSAWIIGIVFPEGFTPSVTVLRILVCAIPLTYGSAVMAQVLVAVNKQRVFARAAVLGMVANVGLNVLLVPQSGVNGAACAALVTEIIILATYILPVRQALLFPTMRTTI